MPAAKPKCPKCSESLERGFLHMPWPQTGGAGLSWAKGRPAAAAAFGLSAKARKQLVVTSWRCTGCGFLESYAS